MLQWLKRRSETARTAENLYGRVVAAARAPELYRDLGATDSPEGRFEAVALHLYLAVDALSQSESGHAESSVSRKTIEAFVTDMDDCMREMGVGDMTVPKKVKRAAAAFYERAIAYRKAVAEPDDQVLEDALTQYVLQEANNAAAAQGLAAYVRSQQARLKGKTADQIFAAD